MFVIHEKYYLYFNILPLLLQILKILLHIFYLHAGKTDVFSSHENEKLCALLYIIA